MRQKIYELVRKAKYIGIYIGIYILYKRKEFSQCGQAFADEAKTSGRCSSQAKA